MRLCAGSPGSVNPRSCRRLGIRPRALATLSTSTAVTTCPDAVPAVGEHLAPGRYDEGVAVRGAAARHRAHRARRHHHRAVLDGPGAVQHVPVRLARHLGERGGHREDLRAGLRRGCGRAAESAGRSRWSSRVGPRGYPPPRRDRRGRRRRTRGTAAWARGPRRTGRSCRSGARMSPRSSMT